MTDNSTDKGLDTTKPPLTRFHLSQRNLLLIVLLAIGLTVLIAYILRSQAKERSMSSKTSLTEDRSAGKKSDEHGGAEHHDEHSQEGAIEVNDETAELVGIKVEKAVLGKIDETVVTTGKVLVAPNNRAIVGAKIDGRAVRVQAELGQSVRAGQVLVIVDSPQIAELRGQLVEARARLKLAEQQLVRTAKSENRASVIQAKNKLDLAESILERKRRLASLGATAGREVAEAETEYKNAKAEFDYQSSIQIAREQQEAENEVEKSRANITRLTQSLTSFGAGTDGQGGILDITSPISGVVVDRHISVGETITSDKELMTVMNLSNVVIEAQMPESQTRRVQVGQRIVARIPGTPEGIIEGKVQSIGSTVDPEKRTVAVRALVANTNAVLKHEMAVEVRVTIGEPRETLVVPSSALVDEEGMKIVYVKEGERYERRPVTVGTINYQRAEILGGIKEGEEVVTAGAYQLANMRKGGGEEGGDHDDH